MSDNIAYASPPPAVHKRTTPASSVCCRDRRIDHPHAAFSCVGQSLANTLR